MCGIFGVAMSNHGEAVSIAKVGIMMLDHRGGQATGIAAYSEKKQIIKHECRLGDTNHLVQKCKWSGNRCRTAIAHTLYSTVDKPRMENIQPMVRRLEGTEVALAHNGEISWIEFEEKRFSVEELKHRLSEDGVTFQGNSDSEILFSLIARSKAPNVPLKIIDVLNRIEGSFALVFLWQGYLIAASDSWQNRNICLGIKGDNLIAFASETVAFDPLCIDYVRELEPGEVIIVDPSLKVTTFRLERAATPAKCSFDLVYFARPDSIMWGLSVSGIRTQLGGVTAIEFCDSLQGRVDLSNSVVIGVLDSGRGAALGVYNHLSNVFPNVQFDFGLNRAHGKRNFTLPNQNQRDVQIDLKHNVDRRVVSGKRIILVDDSRVRGTTLKRVVEKLQRAGAAEIHLLIASPLVIGQCHLGINMKGLASLVANRETIEVSRQNLGVDSLYHLSLDGFKSVYPDHQSFCMGCLTNEYPIESPFAAATL